MQRRALIVDDEPTMCELIQEVLVSTGMEVVTFTRSADATGYLRDQKFDVVLLDLCMPAPDGIALAQQMRGSGFNQMTPIIMISDDQQPGASFFLYKPIDKGRLLKLIRATQGTIEHERRRFRRIPFHSKVQLRFDKAELEGETIDVSLNGLLVKAPHTVPVGSTVQVSLSLSPGMKPIDGRGSVKRVIGANQMGILLDRLSMAESWRFQDFLLPLISP